jgi:site-specific DNA-cytosine methylase
MAAAALAKVLEAIVVELATVGDQVVAEPFRGLGTCYEMLRLGPCEVTVSNGCEHDPMFEQFYENVDISRNTNVLDSVMVGSEGDFAKIPNEGATDATGLCAGPPCGPWAPIGARLGEKDTRVELYIKVIDLIILLGKRKVLKWFALENSEKISNAFLDKMKERIREGLPDWGVDVVVSDLTQFLPHHRVRTWIRGLDAACNNGSKQLPPPIKRFGSGPPTLASMLDSNVPNFMLSDLSTEKKKNNAAAYLLKIEADKVASKAGEIAVLEIDRSASRRWSMTCLYDTVPSFRCKGPDFLLMSVGGPTEQVGSRLCRLLTPTERFRLLGHDTKLVPCFPGKCAAVKAAGNAFAVPMCASVTIPLMQAVASAQSADRCASIVSGKRPRIA